MTSNRSLFETYPRFATDKWGRISNFIVSLSSTSYMGGVFILVLQHKDNKLLSIYTNIKSQDDFYIYCLDVVIIKAFLFFVPLRKSFRGDEFTDVGKFLREYIHFLVQLLVGNLGVYLCAGDTFVPQYAADRLDRHAVGKAYHRCHRVACHVPSNVFVDAAFLHDGT